MARTELVRSVGGFDEALTLGEDFDLWLRIAPFHRVIRVPEVLAFYRFHEGPQATKNREKTITNRWRIQQKFLNLHPQSVRHMTRSHVRELTHGDLMRRGFDCYWQEDLDTARRVFRLVMRTGYGSASDWLYMLPSLMPMSWHRRLLARMRSRKSRNSVEPK